MVWNMGELYYLGTSIALIVAIYSFVRGFNVLNKLEERQWKEQYQKSIEAIDRLVGK